MTESLNFFVLGYIEHFSYLGVFLFLFLCGLGLPVPEELILLSAGFLSSLGYTNFYPTAGVAYAGVVISDLLIYGVGRQWGHDLIHHRHIRKFIRPRHLDKIHYYFHRYGSRAIFFARFASGLRAPIFWVAGTLKMSLARFLLTDMGAALICVPLMVFLGGYFGEDLEHGLALLDRADKTALSLVGVAVVAALVYRMARGRAPQMTLSGQDPDAD